MSIEIRNRKRPLKVYVASAERKTIVERAAASRLSISDYLRTLGMGHELKSMFDRDSILRLIKLHADQGRLGGLLKLWLSQKSNEAVSASEIRKLLKEIESVQSLIKEVVKAL